MSDYSSNIYKVNAFSFFYMFLIIIPVLVPYFLALGLNMEEVFIVQACFGLTMALFEVPSAYLGDLWGRKHVMMLGSFITGLGFSFLLIAKDFYSLILYEMFLGIGASFVSGAGIAIIYDTLKDKPGEQLKAMGNLQSLKLIGEATAAIICSVLVVYGFNFVVWGQITVAWLPFIISLTIREPKIERMDKNTHKENFKEVLRYIFIDHRFVRLIFINMVLWSLSTFYAAWIIQKYLKEQNFSLSFLCVFWSLLSLTAAYSSRRTIAWERRYGPHRLLGSMCILVVVAYITLGFVAGHIGVLTCLLFYISRGINTVIMRDAFNSRIESKFRNTANSLVSLFFRLGFFLTGPLVGFLIDRFGLSVAMISIGGFYLLFFLGFTLPFIKSIPMSLETTRPSQ